MVARDDLVLALSNSGETDEVLAVLPAIKRLGVPLILLTGSPASTLARQADVILDVGVAEEACPMNLAPTSSTTAALAMGDALAMALLDLRGLGPEDYAALHPRGSARLAVALQGAGPHAHGRRPAGGERDGDDEGSDRGDGRQAARHDHGGGRGGTPGRASSRTATCDASSWRTGRFSTGGRADCMTANPKRIGADELAARALALMEGVITSLVITDETGRPAGVIHIHDILRARIV